jgi:hypothetical protein
VTQFCGAQCAFGICGDDYAVDVVQDPATELIYVIGRQCGNGGCFLRVNRLSSSGEPKNQTLLTQNDWFLGQDITTPTAGAFKDGKLVVVGSTQASPNPSQNNRYGFVAIFDVSNSSSAPELLVTRRETKPGVILDVAINSSGQPVVAGFLEPGGPGSPSQREPWAMRYVIDANGITVNTGWEQNLSFTLASGSCRNADAEDKIVSVEMVENYPNVYLFAGQTYDDEDQAHVGCVIQLGHANGAPLGIKKVPLGENIAHQGLRRMRMQPCSGDCALEGLLMGSAQEFDDTGVKQEMMRPFAVPFSFTVNQTGNVALINFSGMEFMTPLDLSGSPGESTIHDACFTPNGHVLLVGEAQPHVLEDVADVTPYFLDYVYAQGEVVAQHAYVPVSVGDYQSVTNDRFRSCSIVVAESALRVMMVGDLQELLASDQGKNDTLMVDVVQGETSAEMGCSGSF